MTSWDIFQEQNDEYKESVLPSLVSSKSSSNTVSIYVEAASTFGWHQYFNVFIGMTTFGASAAKNDVYEHFGFTANKIAIKSLSSVGIHTL